MRRNVLWLRENAVHRAQVLAAIGRRLRDEYDIAQPLPGRLSDLLSQLGQPSEGRRAFPSDADTKKASVR